MRDLDSRPKLSSPPTSPVSPAWWTVHESMSYASEYTVRTRQPGFAQPSSSMCGVGSVRTYGGDSPSRLHLHNPKLGSHLSYSSPLPPRPVPVDRQHSDFWIGNSQRASKTSAPSPMYQHAVETDRDRRCLLQGPSRNAQHWCLTPRRPWAALRRTRPPCLSIMVSIGPAMGLAQLGSRCMLHATRRPGRSGPRRLCRVHFADTQV